MSKSNVLQWNSVSPMPPRQWVCGYCNLAVGGSSGFKHAYAESWVIYPCPSCGKPTYFAGDIQMPGVAFGNSVNHLPPDVAGLYAEARNCMAVNAFTSAVLACRKLLMNVSVANGAPSGKHFIEYVQFLADSGYVPPKGKAWVDHIRKKGNEATHEIHLMGRQDAEDLITFVEMLLKFVFEFPGKIGAP